MSRRVEEAASQPGYTHLLLLGSDVVSGKKPTEFYVSDSTQIYYEHCKSQNSSPSVEVHEVLECNFLFPAFVPFGSPLGLYGDTDKKPGKFSLKLLVSGSALGGVTLANSAACMAAEVV